MYKFQLGDMVLPVAPSKFSIKIGNSNKTMELIDGSEINFLREPKLTEFSFEFLIPSVYYPFAQYQSHAEGFKVEKMADTKYFISPEYYTTMLKKYKTEKKPVSFQVTRVLPNGKEYLKGESIQVSIEDYSLTESASDGFDITASVSLKYYNAVVSAKNRIVENEEGEKEVKTETERPDSKEEPQSYTVKSGDSLWAICKANLGDGSKCWDIAKKNNIQNPNLIYPGQVIKFD